MRKAYRTLDLTEAVLVKDYLVRNGVEASVLNLGLVRVPADGVASEVWVADDANAEDVRALIRGFLRMRQEGVKSPMRSWRCSACGEQNPGEFETCWNCGAPSTAQNAPVP